MTELASLTPLQLTLFGGLIGLVVGSFISMLSWRLPRLLIAGEEQILKHISVGGSQCPHCHQRLRWFQLIPLFSWLSSKGRCQHCQHRISARYPIIELSSAGFTVASLLIFGPTWVGFVAILFSWILLTISIIDMEHQLILDVLSLPLLWLGLLVNTQDLFASPIEAIWGAAIGYLILWLMFHTFKRLTGKEGMGYGDFKLLAALGAWFGLAALPQLILLASVSSLVIGLGAVLLKLRDYNQPLAFGPFLALAGWITLFIGPVLL